MRAFPEVALTTVGTDIARTQGRPCFGGDKLTSRTVVLHRLVTRGTSIFSRNRRVGGAFDPDIRHGRCVGLSRLCWGL